MSTGRSVLPNLTYRFRAISVKIPARYLVTINKLILNLICRDNRPVTANTVSKEENMCSGLLLLEFKT